MKTESIIRSLLIAGVMMISLGLIAFNKEQIDLKEDSLAYLKTDVSYVKKTPLTQNREVEETDDLGLTNVSVKPAKGGLIRKEVVDHFTREEIIEKLNNKLGGVLSGKGQLIVDTSLEKGVDPFVAAAIMMHETGNGTSKIARTCNNVGGQKGSGCGAYQAFSDINTGIVGMINNLYKNFYSRGLNTIDSIGPRYAESGSWPAKIHYYVNMLKK
jgi:hypothetical protein